MFENCQFQSSQGNWLVLREISNEARNIRRADAVAKEKLGIHSLKGDVAKHVSL
jgi:hypothetical protein